jgi:putative DNA primase/helicase
MSEFLNFAAERGLIIRHLVHGRWSRVPTVDHPHKRNGAYWFGGDFAHVQNWATMEQVESWQENKIRTPFEQADMQKRIDASRKAYAKEREEGQHKATNKAKWILSQCELDIHAYTDSKGFPDMRVNVWRKNDNAPLMVIPMFHRGQICGCQLIGIDGSKKFLTGQRTNDASFIFDANGPVFLCEGWATGASLRAVLAALRLPYTIHACFSAGNLGRMAKAFPEALILADNDVSQTGQKVAIESGNRWWMPEVVGTDFNDLYKEIGLFKTSQIVRKQLLELRKK